MRKLIFSLIFSVIYSAQATTLLSAHPISTALARTLLEHSDITLHSATPETLPANRHLHYLQHRGQENLAKLSQESDAVLSIASISEQDKIYALARREHIRLIPIDIATPLDGQSSNIALANVVLKEHPVWLNPDNLSAMMSLFTREISRLEPNSSNILNDNNAREQKRLQNLTDQAQSFLLAASDEPTFLLLNPELVYFAQGLQLESVTLNTPLSETELSTLKARYPLPIVLTYAPLNAKQEALFAAEGIAVLALNRLNTHNPIDQLSAHYAALHTLLNQHAAANHNP